MEGDALFPLKWRGMHSSHLIGGGCTPPTFKIRKGGVCSLWTLIRIQLEMEGDAFFPLKSRWMHLSHFLNWKWRSMHSLDFNYNSIRNGGGCSLPTQMKGDALLPLFKSEIEGVAHLSFLIIY